MCSLAFLGSPGHLPELDSHSKVPCAKSMHTNGIGQSLLKIIDQGSQAFDGKYCKVFIIKQIAVDGHILQKDW